MLLSHARRWSILTVAVFVFFATSTGQLSRTAHAAAETGVCVAVKMDLVDLHLSYRKELQVRIDRKLAASRINHLGVNLKDNTIEVLVADAGDTDRAAAAIQEINTPLDLYGSEEFDLVNNGDGRLLITTSTGAFTEAEDAAMSALASRMKLLANRITNGQSKYTPEGRESFLVFAPGINDLKEFRRRVSFTPGVDLSFRLWKKPKEGEADVAHEPGTMEPVRRGFTNRRLVLVPRQAFADGRDIVGAVADMVDGQSGLSLQFSGRGAQKVNGVTQSNKGAIIAVLLSNIIFGEYVIDRPVTGAKLFVPIKGTEEELGWLADKIQAGGYQPAYTIEESTKCKT